MLCIFRQYSYIIHDKADSSASSSWEVIIAQMFCCEHTYLYDLLSRLLRISESGEDLANLYLIIGYNELCIMRSDSPWIGLLILTLQPCGRNTI